MPDHAEVCNLFYVMAMYVDFLCRIRYHKKQKVFLMNVASKAGTYIVGETAQSEIRPEIQIVVVEISPA
jgi:hypothetical protein